MCTPLFKCMETLQYMKDNVSRFMTSCLCFCYSLIYFIVNIPKNSQWMHATDKYCACIPNLMNLVNLCHQALLLFNICDEPYCRTDCHVPSSPWTLTLPRILTLTYELTCCFWSVLGICWHKKLALFFNHIHYWNGYSKYFIKTLTYRNRVTLNVIVFFFSPIGSWSLAPLSRSKIHKLHVSLLIYTLLSMKLACSLVRNLGLLFSWKTLWHAGWTFAWSICRRAQNWTWIYSYISFPEPFKFDLTEKESVYLSQGSTKYNNSTVRQGCQCWVIMTSFWL